MTTTERLFTLDSWAQLPHSANARTQNIRRSDEMSSHQSNRGYATAWIVIKSASHQWSGPSVGPPHQPQTVSARYCRLSQRIATLSERREYLRHQVLPHVSVDEEQCAMLPEHIARHTEWTELRMANTNRSSQPAGRPTYETTNQPTHQPIKQPTDQL